MKLFGNKKRRQTETRAVRPTVREEHKAPSKPAPAQPQEETGRLSGRTKAFVMLACSLCLFVCAVAMCLTLIRQSAKAMELPSVGDYDEIKYFVNTEQPSAVEVPLELEAPVSVNNSDKINILLVGLDEQTNRTDAVMIVGIDLRTRTLSLLSIPRDTYISGNYDTPKIQNVYAEADDGEDRGIQALREKTKEMLGFWTDYYFILDEQALTAMTESVGGVAFDVPGEPNYCALPSGMQTLNGSDAIEIFRYRGDYTDVETEPSRVQRMFVFALLEKLLENPENFTENAVAICNAARTDLSAEQLAYFAYLLEDTDFDTVFSRALPGGEIQVSGVSYYEVNAEEAVEMLNEYFNPLEEDLRVYDVNFRQKTGASGDGEYSPYGYSNSSEEDDDGRTGHNPEPTEGSDPPESSDPSPSETEQENPTEPTEQNPSETEPPVTDPTEE